MKGSNGEGVYTPAFDKGRESLRKLDPEHVALVAGGTYDAARKIFYLTSFGQEFAIEYPEGTPRFAGSHREPHVSWGLILLNYLSSARALPLADSWVSYRDLPGGNVFYPSIRTYVLDPLGKYFSECDRNALKTAAECSGFRTVSTKADWAVQGLFAPRVPVLVQFWEGEGDEIPGSCQILFDRTVAEHMHIEDIAALCSVVRELLTKLER